jgi:hypothetical protein
MNLDEVNRLTNQPNNNPMSEEEMLEMRKELDKRKYVENINMVRFELDTYTDIITKLNGLPPLNLELQTKKQESLNVLQSNMINLIHNMTNPNSNTKQ